MQKLKKMTALMLSVIMVVCMLAVPTGAASKLAAPSDIQVILNDERGICLQWTPIEGADLYRVFMYSAKTKKYAKVTDTPGKMFMKNDIEPDTTYKFKVATLRYDGKDKNGLPKPKLQNTSSAVTVRTKKMVFAAPKLKKCTTGDDYVKIDFTYVEGAKKFRLYLYNEKTKKYELKKETNSTTFLLEGLEPGTKYRLRLTAAFDYGTKYENKEAGNRFGILTSGTAKKTDTKKTDSTKTDTAKTDTAKTDKSSVKVGTFTKSSPGDSPAAVLKRNGIAEGSYTTEKKKSVVKYTASVKWQGKVCIYEASFVNDKLSLESIICEGTKAEFEKYLAEMKKTLGEPSLFGDKYMWSIGGDSEAAISYSDPLGSTILSYMYDFV